MEDSIKRECILGTLQVHGIELKSQGSDGTIKTWDADKYKVAACVSQMLKTGLLSKEQIRINVSDYDESYRIITIKV